MSDSASPSTAPSISAVVPARNEEAVIANCVKSLAAQPEISEIVVIDDQSSDRTATIVESLAGEIPRLRLVKVHNVPAGWLGKNNAVSIGAKQTTKRWLLFTDADAELLPQAAARALKVAQDANAALVSFSPEQVTKTWYEKSLIPFVYCRLALFFSYQQINDANSDAAAANGQFLMVRRDAYDTAGGHASVSNEILEDVALARAVKSLGYRISFGPGKGIVRVRMYRSFVEMWAGWKKNLFLLVGNMPAAVYRELFSIVPWIPLLLVILALKYPLALVLGLGLLLARHAAYGMTLSRNQYPLWFILYYIPGVLLYGGVLWASYRAHRKRRIEWKGRKIG
jgi:glycosyltransferase involved in cell wall biosynthesis